MCSYLFFRIDVIEGRNLSKDPYVINDHLESIISVGLDAPVLCMYWWYSEIMSALTLLGIVVIFDKIQESVAGNSIYATRVAQYYYFHVQFVSLDRQAFTSCTGTVAYDKLSRGTHQVTVRATEEAGNAGEDRFLFYLRQSMIS